MQGAVLLVVADFRREGHLWFAGSLFFVFELAERVSISWREPLRVEEFGSLAHLVILDQRRGQLEEARVVMRTGSVGARTFCVHNSGVGLP